MLIAIGVLFWCTSSSNAQRGQIYPADGNTSSPIRPIPAGNIVLGFQPSEPVGSLDQLIRMSQFIVDGTVSSVLPTVILNPRIPGEVETDSIISVNSVILGQPPDSGRLLLVETGGLQGIWTVSIRGNPRVQTGERWVLFLAADRRATIPNASGVLPDRSVAPRFYAVGSASGKALVSSEGVIGFAEGAIPELHRFDGAAVIDFEQTLASHIAALHPTPPPYPLGVAPRVDPNRSIFHSPDSK